MSLSVDFNDLAGAVIAGDFMDGDLLVDGRVSTREKEFIQSRITPEQNSILLKSLGGFEVLTYIYWITEPAVTTQLFFKDNSDHKAELDRFKGQQPDVGYTISNMPKHGLFGFVCSLYFSDHFKTNNGILPGSLRTAPHIRINT